MGGGRAVCARREGAGMPGAARRWHGWLAAAWLALLAACSGADILDPSSDGSSATAGAGTMAVLLDELAQGLMFRPSLPDDCGMLLLFSEERLPNIWMMNTLVALDIIYLDQLGVVVDVITDAQPCPAEPCPRFTPKKAASAVLEVPAGVAQRHGVVEGVQLTFERIPDFPTDE